MKRIEQQKKPLNKKSLMFIVFLSVFALAVFVMIFLVVKLMIAMYG